MYNIESQEIEHCKVKINYAGDPSVVLEKRKDALKQLKGAPVSGFRPGKAPESAVKTKYKDRINDWVKREMITVAYDDTVFELKCKTIGQPQLVSMKLDGDNFNCELMLLKKPDFELGEVKGLEVPKPHIPTTVPEMAEIIIQQLRMQHGDSRPYEENDFVQTNDKLTMDVEVILDGTKIDGLTQQGILYTVGENYLVGFDDNLLGCGAGEEREFEAPLSGKVLPTQDGKMAKVKVLVHMGMRTVPCALDDEFAKKINYQTYDELRKAVDAVADQRYNATRDQLVAEQVKRQLVERTDIKLPQWLVLMESQQMAAMEAVKWDSLTDEVRESYNERASKNVKFALILDSIRETVPEAELSESEAVEMLKRKLAMMGSPNPEAFLGQAQNNGKIAGMLAAVKNEFALQYVVNNVKLVE